MEENIFSLLNSSESILVVLPSKPFFDQVAAGLSLFLTLRGEKDISVTCPSDMTVEFNRLVGVNKITKEVGNKNMVIRFADFQAMGIERVSYDIDDGEFKLTVIPKSGIKPPNKDQVVISYSGVSADTIVLIGGANTSHFPILAAKELEGVRKIHLGVRNLVGIDEKMVSIVKPLSSDSELLSSFIKQSGKNVDEDIATNLLAGIESGSNGFGSSLVTADTFQIVADLMRAGGKRTREKEENFPIGTIPQKDENADPKPSQWSGTKVFKGPSIN
jgi:hypothetical protein